MAFVALVFLPDSPDKARYLTEEEKDIAKARAIRQVGIEGADRIGGVSFEDIVPALLDIKNWITAVSHAFYGKNIDLLICFTMQLMYFSVNVSFASLPVFLPTILKGMGFSDINAQGLSAPPYFLAFIISLASTYITDRAGQRGIVIIVTSLTGAIGYTILATVKGVAPRYFAVFLAAAGMFPAIFNIAPWVINNQGSDTKRGIGIVLLQMFGCCGPLLGTRLFPVSEGVYYVKGMAVCAAFMYLSSILAFVLRCYLAWENKKADEREAAIIPALDVEKITNVAIENDGVGFRNVL